MVSNVGFGYQPSAAYQNGAATGASPQEPKRTDQTQPREAPAASSQNAEQRTLASRDDDKQQSAPKEQSESSSSQERGSVVNITA